MDFVGGREGGGDSFEDCTSTMRRKTFELLVRTFGEFVLAFWDTYVFGFVVGVISDF